MLYSSGRIGWLRASYRAQSEVTRSEMFLGMSQKKVLKFPSRAKPSEQVVTGESALDVLSWSGCDGNMVKWWREAGWGWLLGTCLQPCLSKPLHSLFPELHGCIYSLPPPSPSSPLLSLSTSHPPAASPARSPFPSPFIYLFILPKARLGCDVFQLPLRTLIDNPLEIIRFLFASVTHLYFIHVLLFWQINVSTAR